MTIHATQHVVDALAIFYPAADAATVLDEIARGVPVEPDTAQSLVGRSRHRPGSSYVLHRERTGLFVIADNGAAVTFLRFYALAQHELTARLWPGGDPPTTTEPAWVRVKAPSPPPGDPGRVRVTGGAMRVVGLSKMEIEALVRAAVDAGEITADGAWTVNGAEVLVAIERRLIRVSAVPVRLSRKTPEQRKAERAAMIAAKLEARRNEADRISAEHLRSRGWTCIPPRGTP